MTAGNSLQTFALGSFTCSSTAVVGRCQRQPTSLVCSGPRSKISLLRETQLLPLPSSFTQLHPSSPSHQTTPRHHDSTRLVHTTKAFIILPSSSIIDGAKAVRNHAEMLRKGASLALSQLVAALLVLWLQLLRRLLLSLEASKLELDLLAQS